MQGLIVSRPRAGSFTVLCKSLFVAAALLLPIHRADAQRSRYRPTPERRLVLRLTQTNDFALRNWAMDVSWHRDGWVEVALTTERWASHDLPWMFTDSSVISGEPASTRALFDPREIAAWVKRADSLLAHPEQFNSAAAGGEAPLRLRVVRSASAGIAQFSQPTFFDLHSGLPVPGRSDVSMGAGICVGWPDVNPELSGFSSALTTGELRAFVAALDTAALRAQPHWTGAPHQIPEPADPFDVGCAARPLRTNPLPTFPSGRASLERSVELRFDAVVDTSGRLDPAILEPRDGGPPALVAAARTALTAWHFVPALLTPDQPVRQTLRIAVRFEPSRSVDLKALDDDAGRHGVQILIIVRPVPVARAANQ